MTWISLGPTVASFIQTCHAVAQTGPQGQTWSTLPNLYPLFLISRMFHKKGSHSMNCALDSSAIPKALRTTKNRLYSGAILSGFFNLAKGRTPSLTSKNRSKNERIMRIAGQPLAPDPSQKRAIYSSFDHEHRLLINEHHLYSDGHESMSRLHSQRHAKNTVWWCEFGISHHIPSHSYRDHVPY